MAIIWKDGSILWDTGSIANSTACCCDCLDMCDYLDELEDTTLTVTISGVTNGSCSDCSKINGTHVLNFFGRSGDAIFWDAQVSPVGVPSCGVSGADYYVYGILSCTNNRLYVAASLGYGAGNYYARYHTGELTPICNRDYESDEFSFEGVFGSSPGLCNTSGWNITWQMPAVW